MAVLRATASLEPRRPQTALASAVVWLVQAAAWGQDASSMADAAVAEGLAGGPPWHAWLACWPVNVLVAALAAWTLFLGLRIFLALGGRRVSPPPLYRMLLDDISNRQYENAQKRLEQRPCLLSALLLPGLRAHHQPMPRIRRAVETAGRRLMARMGQDASRLAGIGTCAFLLGLLGTMWTMTDLFAALHAEAPHGFRALGLSTAVAAAMATALLGLAVGVVSVGLHFAAKDRIKSVFGRLEEQSEALLDALEDSRESP